MIIIAYCYILYCIFPALVFDEVKKRKVFAEKIPIKDFIYCIENAYLIERHSLRYQILIPTP